MAKILRCSDVGFECDGVIRAETEEEVLKKAADHAKSEHNLEEISDEVVEKVRAVIQDE
jgi:predicted small metal-binding protein